jgi:hypothetical protein
MQLFVAGPEYTMWMISYPKKLREKLKNPIPSEVISFLSPIGFTGCKQPDAEL